MKLRIATITSFITLIIIISNEIQAQNWMPCGLEDKSILCIAVNPVDKNKIFVGVQDEGIYCSSDGGETWSLSWGNESVNSITIDRFDTRLIYAGKKDGILISRDEGNSFTTLASLEYTIINSIVLDEPPAKAIILGTSTGVYKSLDKGRTFQSAGLSDQDVTSITVNNKSAKPIIYCATVGSGVYKSANYGLTWTPENKGLPEYDLDVYFILCNLFIPSNLILGTLESGIYISEDNAENWVKAETGLISKQGYTITHALDFKANKIVLFATNFSGEIIRSDDFGKNWQNIETSLKDISGLCIGVTNLFPSTVYIGTTNGIYKLEEKEN